MIKIETNDLEKFEVRIGKTIAKHPEKVKQAITKSTMSIKRNAMQNLTSNGSVKTGHLRRSIGTKITASTGEVNTSNVKYAAGVENGTKAHVIRPKTKKMLYWQGAAHPVKQVNHPGSKGKPFLKPALEKEKSGFVKNLKEITRIEE